MKRKLVEYEVFEKMKENPLTESVKELIEAEEHLARALDIDSLKLTSFNNSKVIYEAADGTYIRANFSLDKKKVNFDGIEQLVIDEASQKEHAKSVLRSMLEAILEDKEAEANDKFEEYMKLRSEAYKRESCANESVIEEAYARLYGSPERTGGKSTPVISVRTGSKDPVKVRAARKAHARHKSSYLKGAEKRKRNRIKERARRKTYKTQYNKLNALNSGSRYTGKRKKMNEWMNISNNVSNYIEFKENAHVASEVSERDGNLAVSIPNSQARNEGKILKMHYDNMLKTDVKVLRESALRLTKDQQFCQMIADVKKFNNISDNKGLEESIGKLVNSYPGVLYLTQYELSNKISKALESVGDVNFGDQTCDFMAEGILRTAHETYSQRVDRIVKLANKEIKEATEDKYLEFQNIIAEFFPGLDESTKLEMKMFEDLYTVALDVRKIAAESNNEVVKNEASEFIVELEAILNQTAVPSLDLAADVADWLEDLAEGNLPGAADEMDVVKTPYNTVNGDHPQMAKNAKVPGHPGAYDDNWGDPAPMIGIDSMARNHGDEARYRSWGNQGGANVWPNLDNPSVLTPFGDYKVKGEKDSDDTLGQWQDSNTAPNLNNPYVPNSVKFPQKTMPDNGVE